MPLPPPQKKMSSDLLCCWPFFPLQVNVQSSSKSSVFWLFSTNSKYSTFSWTESTADALVHLSSTSSMVQNITSKLEEGGRASRECQIICRVQKTCTNVDWLICHLYYEKRQLFWCILEYIPMYSDVKLTMNEQKTNKNKYMNTGNPFYCTEKCSITMMLEGRIQRFGHVQCKILWVSTQVQYIINYILDDSTILYI